MALCHTPRVREAHILLMHAANISSFSGHTDKCSAVSFHTTSLWSIDLKRHHSRWHRRIFSFPFLLHFNHATRTFRNPWIFVPTASVAQGRRPIVTSEDRDSEPLLTFSYEPPALSSEDQEADGGGLYNTNSTVDSREQLRRERIASANKGRVPWNKGRRHSPETIKKIKERTKVAMLNPEVRDKLRHCGKNQSTKTKAKIRESLIDYWDKKRVIKEAQALCLLEWKEVTANAARVGAPGEEEYEWDSYSKVKEQYRLEELRAVRQAREAQRARKKLERKKLPVSDAHRKAISDAIRAKWNDPEYQARVFAGMAKKVGMKGRQRPPPSSKFISNTPNIEVTSTKMVNTDASPDEILVEKKRSPQPTDDEAFIAQVLAEEVTLQSKSERSTAARKKGPTKVTLVNRRDHSMLSNVDRMTGIMTDKRRPEVALPVKRAVPESDVRTSTTGPGNALLSSRISAQSYKDPLVLEKVQRIQQLREGRLEVELKRKEAADRARMLIANAEKAAIALEKVGNADPATLATLRETRRLLAEATRSVQAAELSQGVF
ncbi:uncharacterized protein [Physcomitrium patens]|uniref:Nuclease associated modular domain-containing protein n=1 Tax=Physcomitrium patens TaxID=3218 RepID=A0A2K1IUX6_PHYPA|nr:uncharacterized protein LOC112273249 isoform X2 [Physcomitrium patens]PNR33079.1 hypothetical protein PHYPA_025022 [Physcomitrium patens]|eukprot:XP_024357521.1 uncharacterized protein LOC112273249 isoform X2 [Physcomitrella patens]